MAFTVNKNLIFIDSMKFMISSLDSLLKNLSKMDFKYLSQEFSGDLYPYEYMDSFEKFSGDKLPDRSKLFSSLKNEYISEKDFLHAMNV